MITRRTFIRSAAALACTLPLAGQKTHALITGEQKHMELDAHLWVYASRFPPQWDCTPILDEAFSDIQSAGFSGIEIMESILRHEGSVDRLRSLTQKYSLPVSGTSYYGDMWMKEEKNKILDDVSTVLEKLHDAGGHMIGITVGDAHRQKTEPELDAQAELLKELMVMCKKNNVVPTLHNHTFEVANGLHDFKGTIERVPEIALGPDLNWLVRGGVDPVWFIHTYGHKMVYMHIRDQTADGKWTEAVGQGTTDFPAIAKALKEINYQGKAAVELAFDAPATRPVREDWKISRDYVKKTFGW